MAATITFDELERDFQSKSSAITSLVVAMSLSRGGVKLFISALQLHLLNRKFLAIIKRIENVCPPDCERIAECMGNMKESLEHVVYGQQTLLRDAEGIKLAIAFMPYLRRDTEELESKLENFWIGSDPEIKDLISHLQLKKHQPHAV